MEQNNNAKNLNVRDWIVLSTTMIAAVLTILALIWQARPSTGIVSITFLLMLSFVFFVNSVSSNSRANFEAKVGKISEKKISNFVTFAEYSFGFGFTLVINAFSILDYKHHLQFYKLFGKNIERFEEFKAKPLDVNRNYLFNLYSA